MRNICSYGIFRHASERCIKNKIKIPARLWISGLSRYMRGQAPFPEVLLLSLTMKSESESEVWERQKIRNKCNSKSVQGKINEENHYC